MEQMVNQHYFWHQLLRWGTRKINSPLLVFALTYVNEDLISLTIWRKKTGMECCRIYFPKWEYVQNLWNLK